ncbi:hypothetical protein [Mucilaginibacter ginsenosidivorax]|uniref:LamG domain-containing protein n=1 Tax=Mucilaginibacter ginsenosidivorax TaxID=862126 RepID=A0A5B8VU61_9SPHI|nr:hypothetical protein [Mucilaginibacter ginsenosidivorax]QEC74989.1 hypothetical protein FSB76_03130 [Mucilaginibacter ginsenosidivorax]
MKTKKITTICIAIAFVLSGVNARAQFGDLLQKAKNKAAQKASDMMDQKKNDAPPEEAGQKKTRAVINSVFDFAAGDSVLVNENFSSVAVGASPHTIKTNGAGDVVTVNGENGKWLALEASATYRLSKQYFYPRHFTLEFDLLASADKINDMSPVFFGFTNDNSAKEYLTGSGEYVSLLYYNNNQITVANQNGKYLTTNYDLTPYANRVMHVSIMVDGERMVAYLDKTKIADTQLFLPSDTKNFFLSAPFKYNNGAKLLFSNLRIATFKKS